VASLRATAALPALMRAFAAATEENPRVRVVHFSIQHDHVHMLVEANSRAALIRGLQGLAIRLAKAVNRALGRRGKVWGDRYHARALTTPREVRNALVYVLTNWQKHERRALGIDPASSGVYFTGWAGGTIHHRGTRPVAIAQTWLLRVGWRRHGLLRIDEQPAPAARSRARVDRI
jgi:hypothetical protein